MNADLMAKLINAKKVMNKVETGNFSKGHVNQANLQKDPEELIASMSTGNLGGLNEGNLPQESEAKGLPQLSGEMYQQRVSESRLPADIKKLMMENHIPQPELNFGSSLDLAFAEKVGKQMEKQGLKKPKQAPAAAPQKTQRIDEDMLNYGNLQAPSTVGLNEAILSEMKPLIKEIIQSTLEATIERVLTEKLAKMEKTQKMDEQLQIRVGDSVFVGKIMGVKTKK